MATETTRLDLKPVNVDAFDEIGEIARAFDELRRFLRLAVGEAGQHGKLNATFMNLLAAANPSWNARSVSSSV